MSWQNPQHEIHKAPVEIVLRRLKLTFQLHRVSPAISLMGEAYLLHEYHQMMGLTKALWNVINLVYLSWSRISPSWMKAIHVGLNVVIILYDHTGSNTFILSHLEYSTLTIKYYHEVSRRNPPNSDREAVQCTAIVLRDESFSNFFTAQMIHNLQVEHCNSTRPSSSEDWSLQYLTNLSTSSMPNLIGQPIDFELCLKCLFKNDSLK